MRTKQRHAGEADQKRAYAGNISTFDMPTGINRFFTCSFNGSGAGDAYISDPA